MSVRLPLLSLACLLGACGSQADPLADDGAPATDSEEGEVTGESDTSTEPEEPPTVWERSFTVSERGRVRDLDVAANGDIVLVQYHEGEEGGLAAEAHGLDEDGNLRWSSDLDIVPEKLCVTASGISYLLGAPWSESGVVQDLHLQQLDASGALVWDRLVAPELTPVTQLAGIECRDGDDAVLVIGTTSDGSDYLVLHDAAGIEVSRETDVFGGTPTESLNSIALREDGYLLVGGAQDAGTHLESTVNYLGPGGALSLRYPIEGVLAMGPWVASRGDVSAIATMQVIDGNYRLTVNGLGDHQQNQALWSNAELAGTPNAVARALTIGSDGRVHVTVPG